LASQYDREQQNVLTRLRRWLQAHNATPKEAKAEIETVLTETNAHELHGGDRDSTGAFQQRPSQGWGPAGESLETDAGQFLAAARKSGDYSGSAGRLAQSVQRSAFPDRYDQRGAEADRLRRGAQGLLKGTGNTGRGTPTAPPPSAPTGDGKALRRQALQQYLVDRGKPDALFALATGLEAAKQDKAPAAPSDARTGLATRRQSKAGAGGKGGSEVLELIHNDGGKGYGIKNGQAVNGAQVFSAVWEGHKNHVHVGAGPKTVVALGKLAQSMGLRVSENPHFGGVTQGAHVPDSLHYRDEAIDVSGDPKVMDEYARKVAQYNRTRKLPT
jgi:hypothetical protein